MRIAGRTLLLAAAVAAQQCALQDSNKRDCYPWGSVDGTTCAAHGCCWSPSSNAGVPWCFYPEMPAPSSAQCSLVTVPSRIDCHPEPNADATSCAARGCCWNPASAPGVNVAACFFPHTDGYTAGPQLPTANGFTSTLTLGSQTGPYRNDVTPARLSVSYLTTSMMRFTIDDPNNQRFVPDLPLPAVPAGPPSGTPDYEVSITQAPQPFGITVTRRSSGQVLFDSRVVTNGSATPFSGLIFEDQYLELSTHLPLPSGPSNSIHIYGLAEHIAPLQLPSDGSGGQLYTLLARDQGTPVHAPGGNTNLYASMPFYMVLDPATGEAFGVWLRNSNAMDVLLQQSALTYRVIGGIMDVFIMTGPTPAAVVAQYLSLVGAPALPPRWSLGFHLCRWGYNNITYEQSIWQSMLDNAMPQDVQWNDIDLFDRHLDFTVDPANFPAAQMKAWAAQMVSQHGQHYMHIIDPAISSSQARGSYSPFDDGIASGIFITYPNGTVYNGSVWPGPTVFPDFTNPNATAWWQRQFAAYISNVFGGNPALLGGAWIDMNEPSNFGTAPYWPGNQVAETGVASPGRSLRASKRRGNKKAGAVSTSKVGKTIKGRPVGDERLIAAATPVPVAYAKQVSGIASEDAGDPTYPPYLPGRPGGATLLEEKTVPMIARQAAGQHYNVHNLYGFTEGIATVAALEAIKGERSLVISRSTFAGSGAHHGHWLGDNDATWDDLYYSLPGVLSMNMLGQPLVGADVCGFGSTPTTPELCTRWMALGAWTYGFYRNHKTIGAPEQAPSVFDEPYRSYMRDSLNDRLTLLPYLYTLFYRAHAGLDGTVTRPLFFEFPSDANVAAIDRQAMLGPAFLVNPVLTEGATTVSAYIPAGAAWYDWNNDFKAFNGTPGAWNTLPAPLGTTPVFVRGGYVVPLQTSNMTTTYTVRNPYTILVALSPQADGSAGAAGQLFLDDGVSLRTYETGNYSLVTYSVTATADGSSGTLRGATAPAAYQPPATASIGLFRILGVKAFSANGTVTINGVGAAFSYDSEAGALLVNTYTTLAVTTTLTLAWSG